MWGSFSFMEHVSPNSFGMGGFWSLAFDLPQSPEVAQRSLPTSTILWFCKDFFYYKGTKHWHRDPPFLEIFKCHVDILLSNLL